MEKASSSEIQRDFPDTPPGHALFFIVWFLPPLLPAWLFVVGADEAL